MNLAVGLAILAGLAAGWCAAVVFLRLLECMDSLWRRNG